MVSPVGSPRVRLLYDHTAGVPGRHEIDDAQELSYAAIFRAIRDTGVTGYVAHEFIPTGDALTSLREAVTMGMRASP